MVQLISWILILITTSQAALAAPPRPISLLWQGDQGAACQKLIEAFLTELRSMAADRAIELDLGGSPQAPASPATPARKIPLRCQARDAVVQAGDDPDPLTMRYLTKASGFDASDWVLFQRRYLRPEDDEITLAPKPAEAVSAPEAVNAPQAATPQEVAKTEETGSKPIYAKWWFWAAVAAVGAGAYALASAASSDAKSGISVEIH